MLSAFSIQIMYTKLYYNAPGNKTMKGKVRPHGGPPQKKERPIGALLCAALFFCLRLAVDAAIDPLFPVGEHELLGQLLLHGGDAPGILAA